MTSRRSSQWPIIISVVIHFTVVVTGMVIADVIVEPERPKPAATIINITMNALEPVIKEKQEQEQEPKIEPEPKSNPKKERFLETVSTSKPESLFKKNIASVLEEKPVPKQKIQEMQQDEQTKAQQLELEQTQQETTKQEFSKEALIIQGQMIGQQLAEQTADAETQYQDQILSLIERNKFFPKRAKKMRQEGDVIATFTLNRDGSIQTLKVLDETAPSLLRRAALKAIRLSELFPPFPISSVRSTWSFETKLSYRLL
jgi:protein TonB